MRRALVFGLALLLILALASWALAQSSGNRGGFTRPGAGNGGARNGGPGSFAPGGPPGQPSGGGGPGSFQPAGPAPERGFDSWTSESTESTESGESAALSMSRPTIVRPTRPMVTPTPAKTGAPLVVYLIAAIFFIAVGGFCMRMSRGTGRC
jgi:hypothetical protein